MSRLWYDHPASEWEEALPIGNGRIGAMVYGGTDRERLQVNEESIWLGGPVNRHNPDAKANLPKIRQLLRDGRIPASDGDRIIGLPGRNASLSDTWGCTIFL